jgi:hypothetical protein
MPSKPWPATLKKKDSKPSTYRDLCTETRAVVRLGEYLYFVLYCWDMDDFDKVTSVLFRAHTSFDAPAERLAAIDSELVDLVAEGDGLLVLENAMGREGYGVLHRLEAPFVKPKKSSPLRFKNANVYTALARDDRGDLFAAGDTLQRFDGKAWASVPVAIGYSSAIRAVATNGRRTLAVGKSGTIVELVNGKVVRHVKGTLTSSEFNAVHVDADDTVSIGGLRGVALQGKGDQLTPLSGFDEDCSFGGCGRFQGHSYWSASGNAGGVYQQRGKRLTRVFDGIGCFGLATSDDFLFVETDEGLARYDGTSWKRLATRYDAVKGVWTVKPTRAGLR